MHGHHSHQARRNSQRRGHLCDQAKGRLAGEIYRRRGGGGGSGIVRSRRLRECTLHVSVMAFAAAKLSCSAGGSRGITGKIVEIAHPLANCPCGFVPWRKITLTAASTRIECTNAKRASKSPRS